MSASSSSSISEFESECVSRMGRGSNCASKWRRKISCVSMGEEDVSCVSEDSGEEVDGECEISAREMGICEVRLRFPSILTASVRLSVIDLMIMFLGGLLGVLMAQINLWISD